MVFLRLVSLLFLTFVFFASSCRSDEEISSAPLLTSAEGLAAAVSNSGVQATADAIVGLLEANAAISIVARIDHAANAQTVGLSLRPTQVILFGNPTLGTPIMQAAQSAGIDLPQKMLVYENSEGDVIVAYNATDYLVRRHGVEGVGTLDQIAMALETLAAAGSAVMENSAGAVGIGDGIISIASNANVSTTYDRLLHALNANPDITVVAELDHQANAASVGLDLRPSRLVVFGNPALGTPLMQAQQSVAIDLPQKMLVWEDADGQTFVSYNRPDFIAERHGLTGVEEPIVRIRAALEGLAATSAGSVE